MIQRLPAPPGLPILFDFWTAAYQAIDDWTTVAEVRPNLGQPKKKTARRTRQWAVYLRKHWRARRDSGPQPSDP